MSKRFRLDVFIVFIFVLCFVKLSHSEEDKIDSLKIVLMNSHSDTSIVYAYLNLSWEYMFKNMDSTLHYLESSIDFMEGKNIPYLQASVFKTLASFYVVQAKYDSAILYFEKALNSVEKINEKERFNRKNIIIELSIYGNIGLAYYYQGKYDKSIENHFKCLKLSKKIDYGKGIAISYNNIGLAYNYINELSKSQYYYRKALKVAKEINDQEAMMLSLNNMGVVYLAIPDYDSAFYYIKKCIAYNEENNIDRELIYNYANLSRIYNYREKYDSALILAKSAVELAENLDIPDGTVLATMIMGEVYLSIKEYDKALHFLKKSLQLSKKTNTKHSIKDCYENLAVIYREMGNYEEAYRDEVKSKLLSDSLLSKESSDRIAVLELKYKIEQQEEEINLLQKQREIQEEEKKTKELIFSFIIVILALVILLVLFAYRSFRQKQTVQREKLERETKKKVIQTTIETADNERKVFADELHEGLGSLLAALRFYINELGNESLKQDEREDLLKSTNHILDKSITNVRAMSNLLMPANLKSLGLEIALQSYCDKVSAYNKIKVVIDFHNLREEYSNNFEITLYRIIIELISSSTKCSKVKNIKLELSDENDHLSVSYHDDRDNFDYQKNDSDKMMKMIDSIINRIESIGGVWMIHSDQGIGFRIEINFRLKDS